MQAWGQDYYLTQSHLFLVVHILFLFSAHFSTMFLLGAWLIWLPHPILFQGFHGQLSHGRKFKCPGLLHQLGNLRSDILISFLVPLSPLLWSKPNNRKQPSPCFPFPQFSLIHLMSPSQKVRVIKHFHVRVHKNPWRHLYRTFWCLPGPSSNS